MLFLLTITSALASIDSFDRAFQTAQPFGFDSVKEAANTVRNVALRRRLTGIADACEMWTTADECAAMQSACLWDEDKCKLVFPTDCDDAAITQFGGQHMTCEGAYIKMDTLDVGGTCSSAPSTTVYLHPGRCTDAFGDTGAMFTCTSTGAIAIENCADGAQIYNMYGVMSSIETQIASTCTAADGSFDKMTCANGILTMGQYDSSNCGSGDAATIMDYSNSCQMYTFDADVVGISIGCNADRGMQIMSMCSSDAKVMELEDNPFLVAQRIAVKMPSGCSEDDGEGSIAECTDTQITVTQYSDTTCSGTGTASSLDLGVTKKQFFPPDGSEDALELVFRAECYSSGGDMWFEMWPGNVWEPATAGLQRSGGYTQVSLDNLRQDGDNLVRVDTGAVVTPELNLDTNPVYMYTDDPGLADRDAVTASRPGDSGSSSSLFVLVASAIGLLLF